ncbi:MAG TPA: hypothetical protein VGV59_15100 [Pyrinomonadaceae bacterium]|nr:hypothetical protein [Pyrinomonadaceae bacterium]
MKNRSLFLLVSTLVVFAPSVYAQTQESAAPQTTYTRPRVINPTQTTGGQQPQTPPTQTAAPQATPAPATHSTGGASVQTNGTTPAPSATSAPVSVPTLGAATPTLFPPVPLQPAQPLPLSKFRARSQEAQRLLKSRVSMTASTPSTAFVTVAALDHDTSQIHTITLLKENFLRRGAEMWLTTSAGLPVRMQVVRSNFVNTALVISDAKGRQLTPLVVQYPIEKFGHYREMAYYTSAHPSLMTPELVKSGQAYVRTMLDLAAKRLHDKGKVISPKIVDIAERLCIVEHVDHDRFRREDRAALYNEVYALFALNELDTYRYSVSSAGAGGMVQMIPSTYQMLRRLHPTVGLNPDFVAGMRNHGNALEAMLLHMQDNWNTLLLSPEANEALASGIATQPELVAAGYNSNSARLPGYIRRGGASWRVLIPRETQMYLQIYKSVESLVQFKSRTEGATKN